MPLHLDDGDRRYVVLATGLNNKHEFTERLGEAPETYFARHKKADF